jgi:hypothetical protein
MSNFYVRGVLANLVPLAILLSCLFIPAGTLNYWQAWVFVAVFGVSAQALGIYFLVHDRKLVERRMNIGPVAEQRPAQKLISALFILGFKPTLVLLALGVQDRRLSARREPRQYLPQKSPDQKNPRAVAFPGEPFE